MKPEESFVFEFYDEDYAEELEEKARPKRLGSLWKINNASI